MVHRTASNRKRKRRCLSASTTDHRKETVSSVKSNTQSNDAEDHPAPPIFPGPVFRPKGGSTILSNQNYAASTNTIIGLNEVWTSYIKLLLRDHMPFEQSKNNIQPNEIASLLSSVELVGAYMKTTRCVSHLSHCRRSGYIFDESANTWMVAIVLNGIA